MCLTLGWKLATERGMAMLNELLVVQRGLPNPPASLHPDVKATGSIPTLLVRLDGRGKVVLIRPVPRDAKAWTLRNGQSNSFPFVQPRAPLLAFAGQDELRNQATERRNQGRREALLRIAEKGWMNFPDFAAWPEDGLLTRLRGRGKQLASLRNTEAGVVSATIDRFVLACEQNADWCPLLLLRSIVKQLVENLRETAQADWIEVAVALLLGKLDKKKRKWECSGALLFEADGFDMPIMNERVAIQVSGVLMHPQDVIGNHQGNGVCGLTGASVPLLEGNFPQPNLPALGQTYLFAKNRAIQACGRYDHFAWSAMPVGQETVARLAAAVGRSGLTAAEREGKTWMKVPGEAPKKTDLLLAFVEAHLDVPAAGLLAEDGEKDSSEEVGGSIGEAAETVAAFEKRTERLIQAVQGKIAGDFRRTPVQLAVLRKVDKANRKVVYAGTPTVGDLYDAARDWSSGERNVPGWLTLLVLRKEEAKPRSMNPPHIAPLGVIPFSRQLFIRQGTEKVEILGIPASEAMGLFLLPVGKQARQDRQRAQRLLRSVLARRNWLVAGVAHAQRRDFGSLKQFDPREALRTVTMLGLLLHKLGRRKEKYMDESAFKLGQLLAAADVVHAGYCADVRGGSLPPSLLGNQVFTMAQTEPAKALATLCRRWKPYDGWTKKTARDRDRVDKLVASNKEKERQRGWDIRMALRDARKMRSLAENLGSSLSSCKADDAFRAELLLGYIAGFSKEPECETEEQ